MDLCVRFACGDSWILYQRDPTMSSVIFTFFEKLFEANPGYLEDCHRKHSTPGTLAEFNAYIDQWSGME